MAAGASWLVTAIVDRFTDRADSAAELEQKAEQHLDGKLSDLGQSIDATVESFGRRISIRISTRMGPFVTDMQNRLDDIRELTEEELRLFAEMNEEIRCALNLLVGVFQTN